MSLHVGIYDHVGWAVAVTAWGDHNVVDRRRIALVADEADDLAQALDVEGVEVEVDLVNVAER